MKVLFISTSNINVPGGDTIQLVSEMNMWNLENEVHYISANKLFRSVIIEELNENVHINFPTNSREVFCDQMKIPAYVDNAVEYAKENQIDLIVCRGSELVKYFHKNHKEVFSKKALAYITDVNNINEKQLGDIFRDAYLIKCQSKRFVEIFSKKLNISSDKFIVQNPIINDEFTEVEKEFDIVYTGKIAPGWGFEYFLKYLEDNQDVKALIIFARMVWYSAEKKSEFRRRMNSLPNVTVYEGLPRTEAINLTKKANLGYCFRDSNIDNEDSHEISTKLLEYCNVGAVPIVRDCKLHREILGNDFVGLVKEENELSTKITKLISESVADEIAKNHKTSLSFVTEETYKKVKNQLANFNNDRNCE